MKRNLIETILGAIVLIVAIFFVVITYQSSGVKKDYNIKLFANFDKVDGITSGSDVRLGGIKIGSVIGLDLDPKTYRARLDFGIQDKIGVPSDSSAVIASDGLLGGKYVNIIPGADENMLKNGGQIEFTQSSVNLEELIGKFAFGSAGGDKNAAKTPAPEAKTSLDTPTLAPTPAPVKKAEAPVKDIEVKKPSIVDVVKPEPAPTPAVTEEEPVEHREPLLLPRNQGAPDAPAAPVTITPKIIRMPQPGDSQ